MQIPVACYLPFCDLLGYVNSGESAGSEMYEKLSAMYIALAFWFIHECILLPPAATYVAGPAAGWPDHRCRSAPDTHTLLLHRVLLL